MKRLENYSLPVAGRVAKRVAVTSFLIAAILAFFSSLCFSQEQSAQAIQELLGSSKINVPEAVLKDFMDGKSKTRVIVNLRDPANENGIRKSFKDMAVRQKLQQEARGMQDRVINALDPSEVRITNRFTYIFGFSAEVTLKGLQALVSNPDVLSIDEDMILHAHLAQGIPLMNADTYRSSFNGSGMAIAICDTGIDYTHPKLGNGSLPNSKVIGGYDTGENDSDPMDGNGHGTCCAGIAAGDTGTTGDYIGGVAYNAKLYALKMTYTATNDSAYTSDMVEAWEWCVTHQNDNASNPIMIISTSFGGGRYLNQSTCDSYSTSMATAAANARAAGMTLFVSSGNDGYCDSTGWPGCLSDVIGIGAVYDANIGRYPPSPYVGCISTSSCTGFTSGCPCPEKCYIDYTTAADQVTTYSNSASFLGLFAPSNNAYTTDIVGAGGYVSGDYTTDFGGTSAACPYAAGAGACLQSAAKAITGSYLTSGQVKSYLVNEGDMITDGKVAITKPRVNLEYAINELYCVDRLTGDFNGDGNEDVLWRNDSTGQTYVWLMDGTSISSQGLPGTVSDMNWHIDQGGDFNGDGKTDLLWYNESTGQTYMWLMNGTAISSHGSPGTVSDMNWYIIGVGDFNGDNSTDIGWYNRSTGQTYIWLMNGTAISSQGLPGTVSDLNWGIIGTGDTDGDGKTDVLWYNESTGQTYMWLMNGTAISSHGLPGTVSDLNWGIIGAGDTDGDGKTDLLWYNESTGQTYMWLMNGTAISSHGLPGTVSDLNWGIRQGADFNGDGKTDILWRNDSTGQTYNGDGKTDILWRNDSTGQTYVWLMNGTSISSQGSPGTVSDLNWDAIDSRGFDTGSNADILWYNDSTGQTYIWLMNGSAISSQGPPGMVSDTRWGIR